jgi:hypothetical protein
MVKKYKIFYKNDITNLYGGSQITLVNDNLEYNEDNDTIYETKINYSNLGDLPFPGTNEVTGYVKDFEYKKTMKNGKKLNYTYTGELSNGIKNGEGTLTVFNDNYTFSKKYEGDFKNNLPHGIGEKTYANGDYYSGSFEEGLRDGVGKYVKNDNDIKYTVPGKWKKNKFIETSNSSINYNDGSVYVGFVKEIIKPLSFEYIKHGQGTLTDNLGNKFVGNWINNELNYGTIEYKNGNKYEGELINLKPDSEGKMKYQNGDTYEGNFSNGMRDFGVYKVNESGLNIDGVWNNEDELLDAEYKYYNGDIFKGEIKEISKNDYFVYRRNGNGELKKVNGDIIKGEWIDDKWNQNKEGQIFYSGGNVYKGEIEEIKNQTENGIFYEYKPTSTSPPPPTVIENPLLTSTSISPPPPTVIENPLLTSTSTSPPPPPPSAPAPATTTSTTTSSPLAPPAPIGTSTSTTSSSTSTTTTPSTSPKEIEVLIKKLLLIFEDEKTKTLVNSFNMLRMNNFIDNNLSQFLIENKITVTFNNTISLIPVFTYMKSKDNDINTIIEMLFAFANYRNVSNNKNSYLFTRNI